MPTPPPPPTTNTHAHTGGAETHTPRPEPAPVRSSTSEKRDPGMERTLWWVLCSACQCGSFDPQPADDRSTLSSRSSARRRRTLPFVREHRRERAAHPPRGGGEIREIQNPACRKMSCGLKAKDVTDESLKQAQALITFSLIWIHCENAAFGRTQVEKFHVWL